MLSQAALDKQNKVLTGDFNDSSQRLDDLHQVRFLCKKLTFVKLFYVVFALKALSEADNNKKKLSIEKGDLEKQIEEAENQLR